MSYVVSPFIPFPNIYWWSAVIETGSILLDAQEHFQKMSYRNRYYISGSNGLIQLSIPLVNGRDQRAAMHKIQIAYNENWQVQHWRTLVSVYARSPYFSYYEPSLKKLFDTSFTFLNEFDLASVNWLREQLKANLDIRFTAQFVKEYPSESIDLRTVLKPGIERQALNNISPYYQVFSDRTGFLPNLSMLDLLFAEGPHSLQWLKEHKNIVQSWREKANTD